MSSLSTGNYFSKRDSMLCIGLALGFVSYLSWRKYRFNRRREKRKAQSSVNIGGIFGMDVGGTLAKIVYFEAKLANSTSSKDHVTALTESSMDDDADIYKVIETTQSLSRDDKPKSTIKKSPSLNKLDEPDHQRALHQLYDDMNKISQNVSPTDRILTRDEKLAFYSEILQGKLHFLHFETRNMVSAISMLSSTQITEHIRSIGCTGGGSQKYARLFKEELGITFSPHDELSSLVKGMHFALINIENECYTYRKIDQTTVSASVVSAKEDANQSPNVNTGRSDSIFSNPMSPSMSSSSSDRPSLLSSSSSEQPQQQPQSQRPSANDLRWRKDLKSTSKKVFIDPFASPTRTTLPTDSQQASRQQSNSFENTRESRYGNNGGGVPSSSTFSHTGPNPSASNVKNMYPYLLVNVGSGVSILKVTSPTQFQRVSGSSLGGGTYWGLSRLLTHCSSYEEVIDLAEEGDATEVDMLVKDIYGGSYDHMNLDGAMVASSFGKLVMKENPRAGIKEQDLAIALLMMITNNIGQVSYLNAKLHNCTKIFFVGSFLRHNAVSCRRLAFAIDFWAKGEMEALFLTHEGYFGALGTFLISAFGDDLDKVLGHVTSDSGLSGASGGEGEKSQEDLHDMSTSSSTLLSTNHPPSESTSLSSSSLTNGNSRKRNTYGIDINFLQFLKSWQPPKVSFSDIQSTSTKQLMNLSNRIYGVDVDAATWRDTSHSPLGDKTATGSVGTANTNAVTLNNSAGSAAVNDDKSHKMNGKKVHSSSSLFNRNASGATDALPSRSSSHNFLIPNSASDDMMVKSRSATLPANLSNLPLSHSYHAPDTSRMASDTHEGDYDNYADHDHDDDDNEIGFDKLKEEKEIEKFFSSSDKDMSQTAVNRNNIINCNRTLSDDVTFLVGTAKRKKELKVVV